MILRITFNDNDYQNVLENIGENMFRLYSYYRMTRLANKSDEVSIKEYVENSKLFDKYLGMIQDEEQFTKQQKLQFIDLIKKNIEAYIEDKYKSAGDYLIKELKISAVQKVGDEWHNGEVLYYFPMNDAYIIM